MTAGPDISSPNGTVLLCFDGSEDAEHAIARAGALLGVRSAVVLTVWEPVKTWAAYDPASIVSSPLARLASEELGLDELVADVAADWVERGTRLARDAGFDARGRLAKGKSWRAICDIAAELDASLIVLGARGLSRVQSALLGSVSAAVTVHAGRPVLVVPSSSRHP